MRKYRHLGTALIAIAWITANSIFAQGGKDYSKFEHSDPNHSRLPCLLCHRREGNAVQPTLPGKDQHTPCAGCHAPLFAAGSGPICTICHVDAGSKTVKDFPPLRSFGSRFDHAVHTTAGAKCSSCHRPMNRGVALTIPIGANAHNACFGCHTPQAKVNGRDISSCGVCHRPGQPERASTYSVAYRRGFSHARHNSTESLGCADCHRVRAGDVTAPISLNHHAPARGFSCMTCHNGKKAFGGDDFSVCTRCHKGSGWRF